MKVKALALALLIAVGSCGFTTSAQGRGPAAPQAQSDKMYRPQSFTDMAFEGILLTVEQQDKINSINQEFASKCEKMRQERKDAKKERKECKKECKKGRKSCCAAADSCRVGRLDGRGPKANRGRVSRDYVEQVKAVLTPEQYTTFLENIVFMPKHPAGPKGPKQCKQDRRGDCQKAVRKAK